MLEQLITEVLRKHNATSDLSEALMDVLTTNRSAVHTHLQTSSDFPSPRQLSEGAITESPTTETFFWERADAEVEVPDADETLPRQGRYLDLGVIGVGGMGEVRRVKDRVLNRVLAMKVIHADLVLKPIGTARFIEEAQIGAQLQHPNIVPVYDMGHLDSGQLYFTMKEVDGRPLSEVIDEVHRAVNNQRWYPTTTGWSFHKLIGAFHDVCKAIEFAHSKGVLHRDLKPENIMLGDFGEVLVVDWGIAKAFGFSEWSSEESIVSTSRSESQVHTRFGQVAGTPAYMSPEQARGETTSVDRRSDVYALGIILYEILKGRPAYSGKSGQEVMRLVLAGPPQSLRAKGTGSNSSKGPLPEELIVACERAISRDKHDRYTTVAELGGVISDWLEGAKKREQALKVVNEALLMEQRQHELVATSTSLQAEVDRALKDIPTWEGESTKAVWWGKEREAEELYRAAQLLEVAGEQKLQAALTHKSDLEEAHSELAKRYRRQHQQAEWKRDVQAAKKAEVRLREHASALSEANPERLSHFAYLEGIGSVSVCTDVEDVEVSLDRYIEHHRRLIPQPTSELGLAPLKSMLLQMGSYRIRLRKEGYHEVLYPLMVSRGEHWDGTSPEGEAAAVHLPKLGELGEEDCYVPAGWFWSGGDNITEGDLPRKRIWVDSYVIRKFPITNAEYLEFVNDLVRAGKEAEALRYVPRERAGNTDQLGAIIFGRNEAGQFILVKDADGDEWLSDHPVSMVDWHGANAYADWLSEKTGLSWRLPHELEWEKAARGVDGRFYVWGDGFDPSYCAMGHSHKGRSTPVTIDRFPIDESVYGVRGLAGNMLEWASNIYHSDWTFPEVQANRLVHSEDFGRSSNGRRSRRGGSWNSDDKSTRVGNRYPHTPTYRGNVGIRLVRSLPAAAKKAT